MRLHLRHACACWVFVVAVVFLMFPISSFAQESTLPTPAGPYGIGTTLRYWIDEGREELYPERDPSRVEFRELMVRLWYPADVPADASPLPYFYPAEELIYFNDMLRRINSHYEVPAAFAELPTHSYLDIPIVDDETRYPVIIFSPGLLVPPTIYQAQIEALVSSGYIVAGIYHTYHTSATVFPDGTVIPMARGYEYAPDVWSDDQRFVLDQLTVLDEGDPQGLFSGRLNLDAVGVYGQSAGGIAANVTMGADARFRAGANLDAPDFDPSHIINDARPLLMMAQRAYQVPEFALRGYAAPAYSLGVEGFLHGTFSDCPLWPNSEEVRGPVACSVDNPQRAISIVNDYLLAFFDTTLKGKPSSLLDGESADYLEVSFVSVDWP